MRCANCDNEIVDVVAAWKAGGGRGSDPIYCDDAECRRVRTAARQRKHRERPPIRPRRRRVDRDAYQVAEFREAVFSIDDDADDIPDASGFQGPIATDPLTIPGAVDPDSLCRVCGDPIDPDDDYFGGLCFDCDTR